MQIMHAPACHQPWTKRNTYSICRRVLTNGAHTRVGSFWVVVTMLGETRRAVARPRLFPRAEQIKWYNTSRTSYYRKNERLHFAHRVRPNLYMLLFLWAQTRHQLASWERRGEMVVHMQKESAPPWLQDIQTFHIPRSTQQDGHYWGNVRLNQPGWIQHQDKAMEYRERRKKKGT